MVENKEIVECYRNKVSNLEKGIKTKSRKNRFNVLNGSIKKQTPRNNLRRGFQ